MAEEGGEGTRSESDCAEAQGGETDGILSAPDAGAPLAKQENGESFGFPAQTPLFYAEQADRYERQNLIKAYEDRFGCRLVALVDVILGEAITYFEELVYDADPGEDLHLILWSPGGDGETAVRLVRSAQARCRELTVIVPDQAKSAATILCLGAHHIMMGPSSDLGPVDPMFFLGPQNPVSAKDLIAAVESAESAVASNPDSYPIHASLLADVTEIQLQQARSALERTEDLVEEALRSNPDRSQAEVDGLKAKLKAPLIDSPKSHAAIFGSSDARSAGLPVKEADPGGEQWKFVWLLWARYFSLLPNRIYEGRKASRVFPPPYFPEP